MKVFTVDELIKVLKKHDPDAIVMLYCSYNAYEIKNIITTKNSVILNAGTTNNTVLFDCDKLER